MDASNFTKTMSKLNDQQKTMFNNIICDVIQKTDLMVNILDILDEKGVYSSTLKDQHREALARFLITYTDSCFAYVFDGVKIDNILPYMKTEIYHVNAAEGYRVATVSEVENGVLGLVKEVRDNIPEQDQKLLNLYQWTLDGNWRYFRAAGYKVDFDENHRVSTTPYQMIIQSANELNKLIDYLNEGKQFDYDLTVLRKLKRAGKYKYPTYARDEIKADISIKVLMFNLSKRLPRGSSNADIRKALSLTIRYNAEEERKAKNRGKNRFAKGFKLEPSDVSFLREVYQHLEESGSTASYDRNSIQIDKNKEICDKIEAGRDAGYIASNHFVFRIIETLKRFGYKKVSTKQLEILNSALNEVDVNKKAAENKAKQAVANKKITGTEYSDLVDLDALSKASTEETPDIFDINTMLGDGLIGQF